FPQPLYEIEYAAPGQVDLAARVRTLLGEHRAALDSDWGLDHGTWSVLRWMYPEATIPVIQLSIDRRMRMNEHYELGRSLADLRYERVLILASGNVVHNLQDAFGRMRSGETDTPDWAQQYDATVKAALEQRDTAKILSLWPESGVGRLAHPTPDHWLPLIYATAAAGDAHDIQFPTEGFDLGSMSMRNVLFA